MKHSTKLFKILKNDILMHELYTINSMLVLSQGLVIKWVHLSTFHSVCTCNMKFGVLHIRSK